MKKEKEFGRRLKSTLVLIEGPRRRISLEALWTTVEHVIRPLDADAVAVIFSLTPKAEVAPSIEGIEFRFVQDQRMKRNEEGEFLAPIEMNFAGKRECYRILEEMEKRRKRRYEAVVYTRLDNYWFAPHPRFDAQEMKSLKLPYTMMIPDGSDWMGLNDRHAWMFREEAEAYFTKRTDNYTNAELAARGMWRVAECHLALAVGYPSERIGRFLPVAAIACLGRRNSSRCGIGPSQGSKWFKYFDEFTWAMAVARSQASWTAINLNVDTRSSIRTSISAP